MSRKIFVNLPVSDLDRAMAFFDQLGFSFDLHFTNQTAACMVIAPDIYAMLLTEDKFRAFTPKPLCDAHRQTEVLLCLSCASRGEVDDLVKKAAAAGGSIYSQPQDHGFMYGHGFQDPDGHLWELVYMEPAHLP